MCTATHAVSPAADLYPAPGHLAFSRSTHDTCAFGKLVFMSDDRDHIPSTEKLMTGMHVCQDKTSVRFIRVQTAEMLPARLIVIGEH